MPRKRSKKGGRVPYPHVKKKDVVYVHCDMEFDTIVKVTNAVEDAYGAYPIRLVENEADLELL